MDRIMIRMPEDMELFMAAISLVQDYAMQLVLQVKNRVRIAGFDIKVEFAQLDQMFFQSLVPRFMTVISKYTDELKRADWDYIIDLTDITPALDMARIPEKHITDVWGIMYGCSPKPIGELGGMSMVKNRIKKCDILIDKQAMDAEKLLEYCELNFPEARVKLMEVQGMPPGLMVRRLADAQLYIGKRSEASYLAAMLGVGLVEQYGTKYPPYLLHKKGLGKYKLLGGAECPAALTWLALEELWQTISDTKYPDATLMGQSVSTVASVAVK